MEPAHLARELRRIAGKVSARLRRLDRRVVRLEPEEPARGRVLFSYILDPFLLRPGEPIPRSHTHFWESHRMAHTFVDLGFTVDAVSWTNRTFEPEEDYDVVVDVRQNLERLAPLLPRALKVAHLDTAHFGFHNAAQEERLTRLRARLRGRRDCRLGAPRTMPPNRLIETAGCATILGNAFTRETYAFAGKPLFRIPISTPALFPDPRDRDFGTARNAFVWLGSGGLVHKGLDLVLEAFAGLPDHRLVVCGPVRREPDFERCYFRELYRTPNIETLGWVDVAGPRFRELAHRSLGVVYPSCSEGGGGSVVTCMHAGLVPVVTREASVDVDDAYGTLLPEATVPAIREAVRELSSRPPSELRRMAGAAWRFARERHTRETFAAAYRDFAEGLVSGRILEGRSEPGRPDRSEHATGPARS